MVRGLGPPAGVEVLWVVASGSPAGGLWFLSSLGREVPCPSGVVSLKDSGVPASGHCLGELSLPGDMYRELRGP